MRIVVLVLLFVSTGSAQHELGIWKMNAARSTFAGDTPPKLFTVRIALRGKGEVFTVDRVEGDGRATSSSTILYLDGVARDFQDFVCTGTQSSSRVDNQAVEIVRKCESGKWIRIIRRQSTHAGELTLEITEQHTDGRRFERRLVLEKQPLSGLALN